MFYLFSEQFSVVFNAVVWADGGRARHSYVKFDDQVGENIGNGYVSRLILKIVFMSTILVNTVQVSC